METYLLILFLIILLLLVFLSALFSFSEMAISSINKTRLMVIANDEKYSSKSHKQANRVLHFIENYNEHITAIVIFNNIVNILFTTLATVFFIAIANKFFDPENAESIGPIMSFSIMTPFVIIFGEIIPKQLAKKFPESGTMKLSWTLYIVNLIMKPITAFLGKIIKEEDNSAFNSDEEINLAISQATEAGITSSFEQNIIKKLLEIDEMKISKIMIPANKVSTLSDKDNKTKVNLVLRKENYTRFPILNDDNKVVSLFSARKYLIDKLKDQTKDLIEYQFDFSKFDVDENPFHVFETLRNRRERMGIIIDSKNEFLGIVTIEDIIELMLGEIYDEDDVKKDGVYTINNSSYIINSNVNVGYWLKNYEPKINFPIKYKEMNIEQWFKTISGIQNVEPGQNYTYKNLIIWTKIDKYENDSIIFEIDIV
ncbi:MAG: hemolysin [Candidatus Tyloplasma litorale]|nr:MAG: hemolysin [Mycoplasmatales bacterium]